MPKNMPKYAKNTFFTPKIFLPQIIFYAKTNLYAKATFVRPFWVIKICSTTIFALKESIE